MKHLLNNLSQEEKSSILEQHKGGKSIDTTKFKKLLESKLGDSKPLVKEQTEGPDKVAFCVIGKIKAKTGVEIKADMADITSFMNACNPSKPDPMACMTKGMEMGMKYGPQFVEVMTKVGPQLPAIMAECSKSSPVKY